MTINDDMAWPQQVLGGMVTPHWDSGSSTGDCFRYEEGGRWWRVEPLQGRITATDAPGSVESAAGRSFEALLEPRFEPALPPRLEARLGAEGGVFLHEAGADPSAASRITPLACQPHCSWSVPPRAWNPRTGRAIVLAEDASAVHRLPVVDYQAIETVAFVPYSRAGTRGADTTAWLVDGLTGSARPSALSARNGDLLWHVGWNDDGQQAFLLHLSRDGRQLRLMALDVATGDARPMLTESSATFVAGLDFAFCGGWATQFTWLGSDAGFLWLSERDGHRQIYRYDSAGRFMQQLTRGESPVVRVEAVDAERGRVFFIAQRVDGIPAERHLHVCQLDGSGSRQLTQSARHHEIHLSPSLRYFIDNHSSPLHPPVAELRSTLGPDAANAADAAGAPAFLLSRADVSQLAAVRGRGPQLAQVLADDGRTRLCAALYVPRDFNEATRYPVIDCIYAGPFERSVPTQFVPRIQALLAEAIAHLGFVVAVIDGRGLPGTSKANQDFTHGRIGQLEIGEHVQVLQQLAAQRPYMDMGRVGVIGHSWGGYFALRAMLTRPDVFKAGVASAPGELTEQAFIMEPYLGLPEANPQGYAKGMNTPLAGQLQGPLLLAHGTADVNAPLSTTMRIVQALVTANRPHELMLLPGVGHALQRHPFWQQAVSRFFLRHLGAPHRAGEGA